MKHAVKSIFVFALTIGCGLLNRPELSIGQELRRLYVGTPTRSVGWFPLYVAEKKGLFREQGLSTQSVLMGSRIAVTALAAKEIPYITALGTVLSGAVAGLPIKLLMVLGGHSHHVLVVRPEITSPQGLRGRTVAISQPGATPHRELLLILKKFGIDPKEVKVLGVGEDMNRVMALKLGQVDAMITGVPYDLIAERDGFKQLVYVKDVAEYPLMGLAAHESRIQGEPAEVNRVLTAILKGIAFTKSRRDEVLPLMKEFIGLDSLETARKAYDAVRDIWPDNGLPSEEGLRTVMAESGISGATPVERVANWGPLKAALAAMKR
jgi:NitT/TauT family transport system substrate-binding protein